MTIAVLVLGVMSFGEWWWPTGELDPRLMGMWEATTLGSEPGVKSRQFSPDGRVVSVVQSVDSAGKLVRHVRTHWWTVKGHDLVQVTSYGTGVWGRYRTLKYRLFKGAPAIAGRYRILEISPTVLRLQRIIENDAPTDMTVDEFHRPTHSPRAR